MNAPDWDLIITSPLQRAKRTAEIINNSLQLPLVEMEDFAERHFGQAEGMALDERNAKFPDKNYPDQEEQESFNNRVLTGIQKVSQMYPNKKVLLVAHGAVINSILLQLSNGDIGSGKTKLMNACISNIHYKEDKWSIKDYNQTSHLSE